MRPTIPLLLASLCWVPAVEAQPDRPGAQRFLEQVFAGYRGGREVPYHDDAAMRTVFSPGLRAAMQRAFAAVKPDEVPCLNGDPIVGAQEIRITNVRIRTEPQGQGRARGTATFRNMGQSRSVRYNLAQIDGAWLIDDIMNRNIPSLRAFLAAC